MSTVRATFWALAAGIIAAYGFFLVLGAFSVGEVAVLSVVVGVLLLAWVAHGLALRRHAAQGSAVTRGARERRGF
jgi:fatty acid desaturase